MKIYQISRYLFITLAILVSSAFIPKIYWLIFDKPVDRPFVQYSCVDNDFVIRYKTDAGNLFITGKGDTIDENTYHKLLPFLYFRVLYQNGTMPDSVSGIAMDPHDINMTNFTFRLNMWDFDHPHYGLNPLFESSNTSDGFNLPSDFFRFSDTGIQFIDSKTNRVNEKKSDLFTLALQDKHFSFPPKLVSGNYLINKKVDDGYFIVDARNHFFNLKMVDTQPEVTIIKIPAELSIKSIHCVELRSREFSNVIMSHKNEIYLLLNEGFTFELLPIINFNTKVDNLQFYGDMLHKNIVVHGPNYTKSTVIDEDYTLVDYTEFRWTESRETTYGKFASLIFPFEIILPESTNGYLRPGFRKPLFKCLFFNIILMLIYGITMISLKEDMKNIHKKTELNIDLVLILTFGIFAFPACISLHQIRKE